MKKQKEANGWRKERSKRRGGGGEAVRSYKDAEREGNIIFLCFKNWAAPLSDGRTQIHTDYHGTVKHDVTTLHEEAQKERGKRKTGNHSIIITLISISPSPSPEEAQTANLE